MAHIDVVDHTDVEQSKATREKFFIDDTFGKARRDTETDPLRQFFQRIADTHHVTRRQMRHAVAQDDPVDCTAIGLGARLARVPDHFGIKAWPLDLVCVGIDLPDKVKIDKAVVHRGDQRISASQSRSAKRAVATRRVHDDNVNRVVPDLERRLKQVRGIVVAFVNDLDLRDMEIKAVPIGKCSAILDIARECALARVEIDRCNFQARVEECNRDMHGSRRLASATFFVAENNNVRFFHRQAWSNWCFRFPRAVSFTPHEVSIKETRMSTAFSTVRSVAALRTRVKNWRQEGLRVALVPTMGALHDGHLSLIRAALGVADRVVATIFVNPTQFGAGEDLDRYPRREAADAAALESAGCHILFAPDVREMYPEGFATEVHVTGITDRLCGASRPGHFAGVATVVAKLLNQAQADAALFGEKDYQQLLTIRRLATDLDIPTQIIGVPTVRESDGLALSSRNAYLSAEERKAAAHFPQILNTVRNQVLTGSTVADVLGKARKALVDAGLRLDYIELSDAETLEPVTDMSRPARLIAAVYAGNTRLIDNISVEASA